MKKKPLSIHSTSDLEAINGIQFTSREIDILACILGGRTTKKIASFLGLSPKTVENYISNIMLKIQCNSRMSIIDFLEKSDKFPLLKNHYMTLLGHPFSEQALNKLEEESNDPEKSQPQSEVHQQRNKLLRKIETIIKRKTWESAPFGFLLLICGIGFAIYQYHPNKENSRFKRDLIRADLVMPIKEVFLDRSELMAQIDNAFKRQEGIQTIALVGIGGSGKTTLARQYAHQQKTSLVWEINSETKSNLKDSFENLASALSITKEDKRALHELREIKNPSDQEKKLIEFVKEHLKLYTNWFLIYDNVEKFSDIQKYFPLDLTTWGQGKIILTTRDGNIQNNSHINHTLKILELNEDQKLDLFAKIITQEAKNSFDAKQIASARKFLKAIPPFPLDVSVAAYYLKTIDISYDKYLENLKRSNTELESTQEDILKDSGDYIQTRYSIITLSLKKLIENHKDFSDLLLFISLLDSQKIPRDLLNYYKSSSIVDKFIYHLKKHSLVTTHSPSNSVETTLSLHRSTQGIILAYLTKTLALGEDKKILKSLTSTIENYIDNTTDLIELKKMKQLIPHLKMFLTHDFLITKNMKNIIFTKLGIIYYYIGDYSEAKQFLENSLSELNKNSSSSIKVLAQALGYLGGIYRELGDYNEAKNLLEKSLLISREQSSDNQFEIARILGHLGNVYRKLGTYEKARIILQESFDMHSQYFPEKHVRIAWSLAHLGNAYRGLGHYTISKDLLERSIQLDEKHTSTPKGSMHNFWMLADLGHTYRKLGNYEKAKIIGEQSVNTYKELFGENDVRTAQRAIELGNVYRSLGKYEKAKNLLEKSHMNYAKHYGEQHVETAGVLRNLGQVYLLEGNLKVAEEFFSKALSVFQQNNHPSVYKCLESFSDLHLKQSHQAIQKNAKEDAQNLKTQGINDLKNALNIIKTHFPKDSPHIERIQSKLNKLK